MKRVRIIIQVTAGVIPNQPVDELSKQFIVDSDAWYAQGEWEGKRKEASAECQRIQQEALDYGASLWNPSMVNWVQINWLYL